MIRSPFVTHGGDEADTTELAQFAADVQYYLRLEPRQLPSRYLYDALGSALFEAICRLPWYRITRAEERLLGRYAADALNRARPSRIIELGSGSGEKLRILLDARDRDGRGIDVDLIDVSAAALDASARAAASSTDVRVSVHQAAYERGLQDAVASRTNADRVLVLFLGSNIGNYDPPGANAFLRALRGRLRAGDMLLLGADLVKPERELRLAYDDPLGVTAAFNRNLLVRINRELGANFDLAAFAHEAVWDAGASRIEMHLVSQSAQVVDVPKSHVELRMAPGERIWTESSYKFQANQIVAVLAAAGFRRVAQWVDREDQFAVTLAEVE